MNCRFAAKFVPFAASVSGHGGGATSGRVDPAGNPFGSSGLLTSSH
jgi:hypothetical protein